MTVLRAQVVFEHQDGLARDEVVNTFHFYSAGAAPGDWDPLFQCLYRFFHVMPVGGTGALDTYMSPALTQFLAKFYVVQDAIVEGHLVSSAGEPDYVAGPVTLSARTSPVVLPHEVAVCLSYRNTAQVNVPKPRRTGRLYLGPYNTSVLEQAAGEVARPKPDYATNVRLSADRLKDESAALGTPWTVYSRPYPGREAYVTPTGKVRRALAARPDGDTYDIDQVWTDNAFDTQRRRGERATAKVTLAV